MGGFSPQNVLNAPPAGQFVPLVCDGVNFNLLDQLVQLVQPWKMVLMLGMDQESSDNTFENMWLLSFAPLGLPNTINGLTLQALYGQLPAFPLIANNFTGSQITAARMYEFCQPLPGNVYINGFRAPGGDPTHVMLYFTNYIAKITDLILPTG